MTTGHIFISYARVDDRGFATWLHDQLTASALPAWLDVYDIPAGADWSAEIDRALRTARALVVVLTPGAALSRQVQSEWSDALDRYLPVLPLHVIECGVPRVLRTINYVDFSTDREAGIASLRLWLRRLDDDRLLHLRQTRAALVEAMHAAVDPQRFEARIRDLDSAIASWEAGAASQHSRVEEGLKAQREELRLASVRRGTGERRRVVGQRPNDVAAFFKNRQQQQEEIGRLLAEPSTRVVTIIGRGGMGKTALAGKVLADLERNRWPHTEDEIPVDGIVYMSTRGSGLTLERLFLDCARLLGGEQEAVLTRVWSSSELSAEEKVRRLFEALANGCYVVLLDNMEDLLDEEGRIMDAGLRTFFDTCLVAHHGTRLLITSRVPLSFRREVMRYDHRVPLIEGLPVPDGVAMLRELDPSGEYGFRDAPEETLTRAVELVHGLPRALEALAGIVKDSLFTTLDEILERLYEEDDVVNALVETGFRRLDQNARQVVQALAVFERPVQLVAVDYLLEGFGGVTDVPGLVRRLARSHIVSVNRADRTISLHPIDRGYAYETLSEEGAFARPLLERRAADYYAQLRMPREQWRGIDDLEPHLLEFEHRVRAGQYDEAAGVLAEIDVEALIWHGHAERARAMHARLEGRIGEPRLQLVHRYGVAHSQMILGPLSAARDGFHGIARMAGTLGDSRLEREATGFYGEALRRTGRLEEGIVHLGRTVQAYAALQDARNEAWWLLLLSLARASAGAHREALADGERALALALAAGDPQTQGRAHNAIALASLLLERLDEAIEHGDHAIRFYREANWLDSSGYVLNLQGMAFMKQGQREEAISRLRAAEALGREGGQLRIEGLALYNLAWCGYTQGKLDDAAALAERATGALARVSSAEASPARFLADALRAACEGDRETEARMLLGAARQSRRTPDLFEAATLARTALRLEEELGTSGLRGEAEARVVAPRPR